MVCVVIRHEQRFAQNRFPVAVRNGSEQIDRFVRNQLTHRFKVCAKSGRPLNLANLARRVIVPNLRTDGVECWSGWHGFRRGLATNLFELGEDEATIQAILRHADVRTTRRHYIKKNVVSEESKHAMNRLAKVFRKMQKPARGRSALGTSVGTPRNRKPQKSQ
jgi:integrase